MPSCNLGVYQDVDVFYDHLNLPFSQFCLVILKTHNFTGFSWWLVKTVLGLLLGEFVIVS